MARLKFIRWKSWSPNNSLDSTRTKWKISGTKSKRFDRFNKRARKTKTNASNRRNKKANNPRSSRRKASSNEPSKQRIQCTSSINRRSTAKLKRQFQAKFISPKNGRQKRKFANWWRAAHNRNRFDRELEAGKIEVGADNEAVLRFGKLPGLAVDFRRWWFVGFDG